MKTAAVIAQRLTAQLLAGPPAAHPSDVAERLLAVQAQDPRGCRLAIRARTSGLHAADVDGALSEGSLVITWLNRGTLHLVRSADYWWLHALTTPPLHSGSARRLRQEGVSPEQAETGVRVVQRTLADHGPQTRAQLREAVAAAGVPVGGQAMVHVLYLASLRGVVVRGPVVGRDHSYVLVRDWLGRAPARVDRDAALAELARRYLRGHAPASDRDLARWAGLPLRDVRRGLALISNELDERVDGLLDLADRRRLDGGPAAQLPPPRLLGAFDPVLLGWVSREPLLGRHEQSLVTDNGLFRPFAMVAGRAVATWTLRGKDITLVPFGRLSTAHRAALDVDAADVVRFLGAVDSRAAPA